MLCDIKLLVNIAPLRWMQGVVAMLILGTLAVVLAALGSRAAQRQTATESAPASALGVTVVREYPHDPHAFTQGLIYRDGSLREYRPNRSIVDPEDSSRDRGDRQATSPGRPVLR